MDTLRRLFYDLAALVARLGLAVIFIAHGWRKIEGGLDATTMMFAQMNIPFPQIAAAITMVVETGAGALLVLGLFTPVAGLALTVIMAGALFMVHLPNGVFVQENGFELVLALGVGSFLLAAGGAGRFSLDHLFFGRRRRRLEELQDARTSDAAGKAGDAASRAGDADVPWQAGGVRSSAAEERKADTPPADLA